MSYEFLKVCYSKPKTLAELKVGDKFIFFPDDGDDHGHGGFKGGAELFEKIEPFHPGKGYHASYINSHKDRTGYVLAAPLSLYVIKIYGVDD